MSIDRNVQVIVAKARIRIAIIVLVFAIVCTFLKLPTWGLSAIVGAFFSYFSLINLINSQVAVLNLKKSSVFFKGFILRLFLYAVPVLLGLKFSAYLNLYIILISLFSFQAHQIIVELNKNIIRYRNRF